MYNTDARVQRFLVMPKAPSQEVQLKALNKIKRTFDDFDNLTKDYRARMLRIYDAWYSFVEARTQEWSTTFKVNKAHEIVEKILPRIIAKDPRWLVTPRSNDFTEGAAFPEITAPVGPERDQQILARKAEIDARIEQARVYSLAIQDYLTYIFDEYSLITPIRIWAKNMVVYGKGVAKVKYKYEKSKVLKRVKKEEPVIGEDGVPTGEMQIVEDKEISEDVVGEYPTIDVKSWTDTYFDPRYVFLDDMPAYIEIVNAVRISELRRKKEYFNIDKLDDLASDSVFRARGTNDYKQKVFAITGIQDVDVNTTVDKNALNVKVYYGYFCETEDNKDEKLYKITTANDLVVIGYEEITKFPFEEINCFEDTETNLPRGFVEPIISMQDEMNFKKNAASEFINHGLYRSWFWSPNSGVDPRDLTMRPNGIIVASNGVQAALQDLQEVPQREINPSYFQEQNDFERQIQGMSFTVDTANPKNQQALTNTATGARIKFFESNSVIDEVRKHFEQGLERLAYKLIQEAFEHMEDNIVIKKMGTEGFWELNKELLRDAVNRYSIKVEVNSSAFDDIESRREDAIAFYNTMLQSFQLGIIGQEQMKEALKEVVQTFEKKDVSKFIPRVDMQQIAGELLPPVPGKPLAQPQQKQGGPAQLTEQVAQGDITSAIR